MTRQTERDEFAHRATQSRASICSTECAKVFGDLRMSSTMDVADLLGALFIVNSERLARYWDDAEGFERFINAQPEIGPSAQYIRQQGWEFFVTQRIEAGRAFKEWTPRFEKIFFLAMKLAQRPWASPGTEAVVFPEHFLLSIIEQGDLDISRRLLASGLRVDSLRRDVEQGIR